jgi:hypothetical protein
MCGYYGHEAGNSTRNYADKRKRNVSFNEEKH